MAKKAKKKAKAKHAVSAPPAEEKVCFVIMPFGDYFDEYYSEIYCPAIADAGLKPRRADDLYRPGSIIHDIWRFTKNSQVMLADLINKNPNVFYELGLAHAIGKPVILVTDNVADAPFDLRPLRVIEYDKNKSSWGDNLREAITQAIRELVADPTLSVLAGFLEVDRAGNVSEVSPRDRDILELKQDIDALRIELQRTARSSPPTNANIPAPPARPRLQYIDAIKAGRASDIRVARSRRNRRCISKSGRTLYVGA